MGEFVKKQNMFNPIPKPHKLTEKEKYEKKLAKLKESRDRQIQRLRESKFKQIKKASAPRLSDLKKALQIKFNRYIRERDLGKECISCPKILVKGNYDAGHFVNQGSCGALRYNPDNVHGQCSPSCNRYKHGNLVEYRIKLVERIGLKKVEWLEAHRHDIKKWTREELKQIEESLK